MTPRPRLAEQQSRKHATVDRAEGGHFIPGEQRPEHLSLVLPREEILVSSRELVLIASQTDLHAAEEDTSKSFYSFVVMITFSVSFFAPHALTVKRFRAPRVCSRHIRADGSIPKKTCSVCTRESWDHSQRLSKRRTLWHGREETIATTSSVV